MKKKVLFGFSTLLILSFVLLSGCKEDDDSIPETTTEQSELLLNVKAVNSGSSSSTLLRCETNG